MTAVLLAFAVLAAIAAPRASAVSDAEELTRFGSTGAGAGQLGFPQGIATDPTTGHVYVADSEPNYRIDEFTPWGKFVKAFGWDVAPGAVNEQQEVRIRAASGQFKLGFGIDTTTDLAFDAPGSESEGPGSVEAALNTLPSIGGANVSVEAVPGTPDGKSPYLYVVTFKGSLAGTNVAQLIAANGTTPLSGGVPSSVLEVRTRADGTAGGTGLESCTAESGCKAGLRGPGAGQLAYIDGIAVDAIGNVYVRELGANGGNNRVQKFDSAGHFLLMFGGEVNKTTNASICTKAQLEGGDECGIGTAGIGPGQFSAGFNRGIALGTGGELFAGDKDRIQRFNLAGEFQALIPVPGQSVQYLAFDPVSGDLYVSFEGGIHKLDSTTGAEISEIESAGFLATDSAGNLYTQGFTGGVPSVQQFDASGKPLSPPSCCSMPAFNDHIWGLGTNVVGDLYTTNSLFSGGNFIRLFGPPPVNFEAAPKVPPTISAQFASSVGRDDAAVAADVNPHFWTDTRYYVQYGTGKCSEGGCPEEIPAPPGGLLTSKVTASEVRTAPVILTGLKAGTTYRYRFVAKSSGGGPVRGVGGKVGVDGGESSFITYPVAPGPRTDCPNRGYRSGPSAPLSDCRAYEMVSPVDKNNGDIRALLDAPSFTTALSQSAEDGSRFTYSSYRAFADPKAAPYTNQYLASREEGVGWSNEALDLAQVSNPTVGGGSIDAIAFENSYKGFSPDLCNGWETQMAEPPPAPGGVEGYRNIYRRKGCGGESYEALTTVKPSVEFAYYYPILQGTSADGEAAVFVAKGGLADGSSSELWQAYYAREGQLHLLCIAPDGVPTGHHCSVGSTTGDLEFDDVLRRERYAIVKHAISADGSKVYWTDTGSEDSEETGPGRVYLRLNPGEEQSAIEGGECSEAEMACTLPVSGTVTSKAARFWAASPDGTKALFEVTAGAQAGNLYLFDLAEPESSTLIATKGLGVAAASEDLSHVYFVSEAVLPDTSGASAGKPNLYLDQEGAKTFIATISKEELTGNPSDVPHRAINHAARASGDGRVLTFISTESLTGYDNTDLASERADSEVYVYEAGSGGPVCVSCNPSRARPTGRVVEMLGVNADGFAAAGYLTTPDNALHSPRVLSADGRRLFFNSYDALLPRDTNGKADVYEWESASGTQECKALGAELYVPSAAGCLSLISSGESPEDSEFLDASKAGKDAFFTTNSSLLPQDPGLIDIYDAREGGGLPAPPAPPGPCQGEACQFAPSPPNDPTPASASFKGAGNLKSAPRCRKGKVARKGRCVAKKRKQARKHKRDANRNRRQSR